MSYKKVADVVAITGKYQGVNGEKNRYLNCGVLLADGDKRAVKLSCIPIDDNGQIVTWLNIYPLKEKEQQPQKQAATADDDFGDREIPF